MCETASKRKRNRETPAIIAQINWNDGTDRPMCKIQGNGKDGVALLRN